MTPAARIAAAIEVLDGILNGSAAEQVLTTWARRNRYAGSGDRAAVRDHVFDALRQRRSLSWLGGAETGRGLMIGALRKEVRDPDEVAWETFYTHGQTSYYGNDREPQGKTSSERCCG